MSRERWRPHQLCDTHHRWRRLSSQPRRPPSQCAYDGADRPGALSFVPAGVEREYSYRVAELTYTGLWLDVEHANAIVGARELQPLLNGRDQLVPTLLSGLRDDIASGHLPSTLYVEHTIALVLLRLARPHSVKTSRAAASVEAPSLARVRDYIAAHLGDDISVGDLAATIDLPADRFARAFRAATGVAPYAYVLRQRVERAEHLLRTTRRPLAQIALDLGFTSQSHFTGVFRRLNGLTPDVYRRGR